MLNWQEALQIGSALASLGSLVATSAMVLSNRAARRLKAILARQRREYDTQLRLMFLEEGGKSGAWPRLAEETSPDQILSFKRGNDGD